MPARRLARRDFATDAATLARRLLGCVVVRMLPTGRRLALRLVETEAYLGVEDRACHSFGARRTPRVEPMYAAAGTSYVYFTYGMHFMLNVVAGAVGEPVAVLLRAGEPCEGLADLRAHRARAGRAVPDHHLARGPGCLAKALALDATHSGLDLTRHPHLWIETGRLSKSELAAVTNTPRVGIDSAGPPWVDAPLRWFVASSPAVSGPRFGVPRTGASP